MRAQFVNRFALILFVICLFFAATLHAQTSTQTTTDSTTDTTQSTTQTTTTQNCAPPCPQPCVTPCPTQVPAPSTGGGTSAELYVNAGGIWPSRIDEIGSNNKIKAQPIYGIKGGF